MVGKKIQNTSQYLKYEFTIYALIIALVFIPLLALYYPEWLIKIESKSLFLYNQTFFEQTILEPGGLLNYISLFLTQFFHFRWGGSILYVMLLILSAYLTKITYRISSHNSIVAFLPAIFILSFGLSTGYAIYVTKSSGYIFMPLVGYSLCTLVTYFLLKIKSPVLSLPTLLIWGLVGFLAFGIYSTLSIISAILIPFRKEPVKGVRMATFVIAVIVIFCIPYSVYRLSVSTSSYLQTLSIGIPKIALTHLPTPSIISLVTLSITQIALSLYRRYDFSKKRNYYMYFVLSTLFVIAIPTLSMFRDYNFRAEIAMSNAIDNGDWERVAKILKRAQISHDSRDGKEYRKLQQRLEQVTDKRRYDEIITEYKHKFYEPTRLMVQYKNLALAKFGLEGNYAFTYLDGSRAQQAKSAIPMALECGKQLYLHYGLPDYSYRWCMEEATEYGWNVETLKYAATYSIITEQYSLALRYLAILKETLFHSDWARSMYRYIANPQLIEKDENLKPIRQLMCHDNKLNNDNSLIEPYLIAHFTKSRSSIASPLFDRVAMLWALQTQDINTFWNCLSYYLDSNPTSSLPRHYQEAALLYSTLEKGVDIREMPISKAVIESYNSFNQYASHNPVRSIVESRVPYCSLYGNTFFYYYFFIRNRQPF